MSEKQLMWRGSVSDFATDIRSELDLDQRRKLASYLLDEMGAAQRQEVIRYLLGLDAESPWASAKQPIPVLQPWVMQLPLMQQSVLMTAVRGPDGVAKYHPVKNLMRWYRRCVLVESFRRHIITVPFNPPKLLDQYGKLGGSFTGPSLTIQEVVAHDKGADPMSPDYDGLKWEYAMNELVVTKYVQSLDELPHHFQMHLMHSVEIVGYQHPDARISEWWRQLYRRLAHDMHLTAETKLEMQRRLGDTMEGWLARSDKATTE